MTTLSIVVPCYNEEKTIPLLYSAVEKSLNTISIDVEYWFIDDGSEDNSLHQIKLLHEMYLNKIHYISFSRNFGKEAALYAGLKSSTGDVVVVMDADLQDPPSLLPKMYKILQKGEYDCVGAQRVDRVGENKIRSFISNQFYRVINLISDTSILPGVRDFRMMNRQMVNAVLKIKEYNRFSKGIFSWVGFKTTYLKYHNVERVAGSSDWTFKQLLKYASNGIIDFSDVPLSIAIWLGTLTSFIALISIIIVIARHFVNPKGSAFGWSSLVCIILLIGGIQLLCTGIVGKYVGKTYMQSKQRPIYIVREKK